MRLAKVILLALFVFQLCQSPCLAAFKSASDAGAQEVTFNPRELPDDLILPMPCNGQLALRGVFISTPGGSILEDQPFKMGLTTLNENRELYEKNFGGHIAGSFALENMPAQWRETLKKSVKGDSNSWYLIGKYEITNQQWDSVMNALNADGKENQAACPKKVEDANLPVSNVSWQEIQEFLGKYNAWLVKEHVESLPAFKGTKNIGFFRLPTEEEWEYAARGGGMVKPEHWEEADIFPLAKDKTINDYGVFQQGVTLEKPRQIGSRNANPLGIFDMVGNVSEMVEGYFRMSIADNINGQVGRRLHGASGGIITKGGSYAKPVDFAVPGAREEIPAYTLNGPARQKDMGFRIVLTGLNISDEKKRDRLLAEEKSLVTSAEKQAGKKLDIQTESPMEMIEALAANSQGDIKDNLLKLKGIVKDREIAQSSQALRDLEHSMRSLLYQTETMRAFAYRCVVTSREIKKIEKVLAGKLDDANRKKVEQLAREAKDDFKDYMHTVEMSANYYKSSIGNIYDKDKTELRRLLDKMRNEYDDKSVFGDHMMQNIDILDKYLEQARAKGMDSLRQKDIIKRIVPERHYKVMMAS